MPDLHPLGAAIGAMLKERGETIAIAESSAGGIVSAALLSVPGASAYFLGGGVLYTYPARDTLLGQAPPKDLQPGTDPYALFLARAVRDRLGATWGVGESGAAGPAGSRYGYAPGHVCIAVAGPVEEARTIETGSPDREANMWRFAGEALQLLESALRKSSG